MSSSPIIDPKLWASHGELVKRASLYRAHDIAVPLYPYLGLMSEVGELADLLKRPVRAGTPLSQMDRDKVLSEVGDVLWYIQAGLQDADDHLVNRVMGTTEALYQSASIERHATSWKHTYGKTFAKENLSQKPEKLLACYFASQLGQSIFEITHGGFSASGALVFLLAQFIGTYVPGATLEDAVRSNIAKIEARLERGTLHNKEARENGC